jgi:pteridine reductase
LLLIVRVRRDVSRKLDVPLFHRATHWIAQSNNITVAEGRMDKTVLITGAGQRIGAQTARTLHEVGYRVAVHYNTSHDQAHALVTSLNATRTDSAFAIQCDLATLEFADQLIAAVNSQWGRLDLLINNASIYEPSNVTSADPNSWDRIISINLRAPYLLSIGAAPMLRENNGAIINLTDIYALRPQAGYAVYCASKAGLIGLTKSLALDLAPDIRVNGVSPGPIVWAAGDGPDHRLEVMEKTPLGRLGATTDIADAVRYLAGAPYITGQIIEVDGGRSIYI